ncbi:MAG: ABC transporter substrate-binding protein [Pseudomonadota bacterium]|nr:ABC transporter substrate-binding protein [Pseudomonadota bacterium]
MKQNTAVLGLFLLFILPIIIVSCSQSSSEPIKIGLAVNLSGRGGEAGESIRDGALLAVKEINEQGGIEGRRLELLVRDDENNDEGIRKADESLIDNQVLAVIGHSYSANTIKAYPIVTAKNTVLITAYSATNSLSKKDDLFLRTSVDCRLYGRKATKLLQKKGISSVAFLMDMTNAAFAVDYVKSVKKYYSGKISTTRFFSRENTDWDQVAKTLLEPQPEAVFLLTEATMTAVILQELQSRKYQGIRLATLWAQNPNLLKFAGRTAEGLSLISYIEPDNQRQTYLEFSKKMVEKFKKPASGRSVRSYSLVRILADALRRCPSINPAELKKSLLAGKYETLMGQVKFDQYGDVIRPVYEIIVRDGRFQNNGEI